MAAKNDIDITIGGKTFTLSGVESEAYLREVASYLNEKLKNFSDDAAYWKLPNDMRNVMLRLFQGAQPGTGAGESGTGAGGSPRPRAAGPG